MLRKLTDTTKALVFYATTLVLVLAVALMLEASAEVGISRLWRPS